MERPRLDDVARAAGVSRTAVSYVLNGRGGVGEETRRHVLDVAGRLGYRHARRQPGTAAPATGTLGAALSPTRHEGETPNYYVAELLAGVEMEARAQGYGVSVAMWEDQRPSALPVRNVDGTLFLGGAFDPAALRALEVPWMLVGTSFSQLRGDAVLADNRRGAYLATWHLLDEGCRRLAFVNGPRTAPTSDSKWLGVRDALFETGVEADVPTHQVDFSPEAGEVAARELLDVPAASRPDGIVVADDAIAVGVLHAAAALGVDVPGELAVVGFGDSPVGAMLRPALSSVRVFQQQMGRLGVRRLIERLEGRAEGDVRILVNPELVPRDSSRRRPDR
jgi:LacI family transcriptional regulator